MLKIFICGSDSKHLRSITEQVEKYVLMSNVVMRIVCAGSNPSAILAYLEKNPGDAGLYIVDLHIDGNESGLALARKIRRLDPRGFIIFVAEDTDAYRHALKLKLEVLDFILKDDPYAEERLRECLDNVTEKFTAKTVAVQERFVLKLAEDMNDFFGNNLAKDSIVTINFNKILCFMTDPSQKNTVVLHTAEGKYPFYGSLKHVEPMLNSVQFFRCQNNLIVNLDKVVALDPIQYILTLENNFTVGISVRKLKGLRERISNYKNNKALRNPQVINIELDEYPLTENGEPDIAAILEAHNISHIDLSKSKVIKVDKENIDMDFLTSYLN